MAKWVESRQTHEPEDMKRLLENIGAYLTIKKSPLSQFWEQAKLLYKDWA